MKNMLKTDGTGLWSNTSTDVKVTKMTCDISKEGQDTWGELKVHFSQDTWDVEHDGLIYTDKLFLETLKGLLSRAKFSKKVIAEVGYSEQGMQGTDYVSLDVGKDFCDEWLTMFTEDKK